ncbi:MAG: hypothetical protein ACI914_001168 [Candidatus Marivariicella framensis]|jgi:hypothetical protein|tara:strand:+ start:1586 stop:2212 length:627 start_codon:yes stop_codon:yes gene_type:complete
MKESLHAEITSLANQISKMEINSSSDEYFNLVIQLFEKIILFKNINQKSKLEDQLEKNNLHLISEEANENNDYKDHTVEPLIETIKEMIPEMPENNLTSNILNDQSNDFLFEKKTSINRIDNQISPKLNDRFAKIFKVDVNDRSAFIQKLFDEKSDEYEKVMKKISSIQDWKSIHEFIQNGVKPNYNSWKDNLLVEKRFFTILKKQFN